jgi:hypothetical protein
MARLMAKLEEVLNAPDKHSRIWLQDRFAEVIRRLNLGVDPKRVMGASFDGQGNPPSGGSIAYVVCPFSGTIDQWHLVADAAGSAVVDVWKAAGTIPTNADSIVGSEKPTLSSDQLNSDTDLTTWTTLDVAAGDVFGFEVESASGLTRITIEIRVVESS